MQTLNDYTIGFMAGIKPDPVLTVSQWADEHRVLSQVSSSEAGRWRTDRTPYLRKIMDSLSVNSPYHRVVFIKGTQLGATECGQNWIGYSIHHVPGPMLAIQPTVDLAKRWSKQRLAPTISDSPVLRGLVREARSRDSGNTVLSKEFPGGILIITGANSAVGLRSMPIEKIFADEVDPYLPDVGGEGDPLSIAEKRTDNFQRRRKIFITSTPTIKGFSRIEREFLATDRQHYFVPCPFCGHFQRLEFRGLKWPKTEEGVYITKDIGYECAACKKIIPEYHKTKMMAAGEWRPVPLTPEQMKLLNIKTQPECPPDVIGFRLPSYYSPIGWVSWKQIADEFIKAKHLNSRELLKTWTNCRDAVTWEERGARPDEHALYARREKYVAEVPAGALLLTAAADVHPDRIEVGVLAWGLAEESWWITYEVFYGSPQENEIWNQLDELLKQEFIHASGLPMKIVCTCIDSGNQTKEVYDFVLPRQKRRIFATKGQSQSGKPVVGRPNKKSVNPVKVFPVGADTGKDVVFGRLKIKNPGPGYMHFPDNFEEEFFFQLTAEEAKTKYINGNPVRYYVQTRERNEALDISVLNLCALIILNVNFEKVAENLEKQIADFKAASGQTPDQPKTINQPIKAKRTGFVHRWKQ